MARDVNDEIIDQNERIQLMSGQNERIDKGIRKGMNLADLIKCNEVKHLWLQSVLITLMLALAIAAIVVHFVM